jgi:hypothetical protein
MICLYQLYHNLLVSAFFGLCISSVGCATRFVYRLMVAY